MGERVDRARRSRYGLRSSDGRRGSIATEQSEGGEPGKAAEQEPKPAHGLNLVPLSSPPSVTPPRVTPPGVPRPTVPVQRPGGGRNFGKSRPPPLLRLPRGAWP